jgi:hypothetical protein
MVRSRCALAFALAIAVGGAACSAQISDGGSRLGATDAGAGGDASGGALTDATATCASRSLYLNFEGQTLTRAAVSDATRNEASWLLNATGTAPAYQAGNGSRDANIKNIVDRVTSQRAQFPITVVTQRPTSGEYMMVVFGGTATQVGSRFGIVNELDCGDLHPNDVAWIADGIPAQRTINGVIGAIGFGLGLTATLDPKDCMCGWDNNCQSNNNTACNLGAPIARDPAARQLCPAAAADQDEVATIRAAFCR